MNRIWNSLKNFLKWHWQPMKAATHCAHWIYFNFKSKWKLNGTKIAKIRSNLRDCNLNFNRSYCNLNFNRSSIHRWTCPFHILIKISIILSLKNDCFYCGFSAHLRVCSDERKNFLKIKTQNWELFWKFCGTCGKNFNEKKMLSWLLWRNSLEFLKM